MQTCNHKSPDHGGRCFKEGQYTLQVHRDPIHVEVVLCREHNQEYIKRKAAINERNARRRTATVAKETRQ